MKNELAVSVAGGGANTVEGWMENVCLAVYNTVLAVQLAVHFQTQPCDELGLLQEHSICTRTETVLSCYA